jgi:subtilase family protein
MNRILLPRPSAFAALLVCLIPVVPQPARATEDPHARYAPPSPRPADVVSPAAAARLARGGLSTVWVYFADKGETDAREFAAAVRSAGARVDARARARRARETGGVFAPDYYDVPVAPRYLDAVRSTGAAIRNASRWLNAVSVEADEAAVHRIASLPFVRSVTLVAHSKRVEPVGDALPIAPDLGREPGFGRELLPGLPSGSRPTLASALDPPGNYGLSLTQLNGINARAAQDSGYTGAGVVVAMLDTGYNKAHTAVVQLKRIGERDFIFHDNETANEAGDITTQWDHGTGTWSVLGGYAPNNLIGPAYNASFLLAKTEDVRTETPIEEDNWLAAVEWGDSLGVDVISSSLGYFFFDNMALNHTYSQMDGKTTTVTKAAALAARRGIVVANAMGNSGSATGSLQSPADADSILSVGAVTDTNVLASFSGRGPTFDGRGKPEVVAQGVSTLWAMAANNTYAQVNGTSLSTPLIGGAAAQVREAHPEWTVQQIRYALKVSGDKAATPDSTAFGWGRPNVVTAIYGTPLGGPIYPKPFNLVFPANAETVTSPPYGFRWRRTMDPDGDALSYRIRLLRVSPDSTVFDSTTTDTSVTFPGYLGPSVTYRWYVSASDPASHARDSRDIFTFVTSSSTGVEPTPPAPGAVLYPNRPNPVRSSTLIPFAISGSASSGPARVTLRIFDATGGLVRTLIENEAEALPVARLANWDGKNQNGRRVSSGIYYYRLTVAGRDLSRRMVVLR